MNDKPAFSENYQLDSGTKAEVPIRSKADPQDPIKTEIDTERYGMAKPKRTIIRAKITHD